MQYSCDAGQNRYLYFNLDDIKCSYIVIKIFGFGLNCPSRQLHCTLTFRSELKLKSSLLVDTDMEQTAQRTS
jgi:hypothetical protein